MDRIHVLCCVTPDGKVVFGPADRDFAARVANNWRASLTDEQRAAHAKAGTIGGFTQITMLKSDYDALPATMTSYELSKPPSSEKADV